MQDQRDIFRFFSIFVFFLACALVTLPACSETDGEPVPDQPLGGGFDTIAMGGASGGTGYIDPSATGSGGTVDTSTGGVISQETGGIVLPPQSGSGGIGITPPPAGSGGIVDPGTGGAAGVIAGTGEPGDGGVVPIPDGGQTDAIVQTTGNTIIPKRCSGDYSETVMIGDSYLAWTNEITIALERYIGGTIDRTYYLSGAGMVKGLMVTIPDQFRLMAVPAGPIETILMTGGGNDVLIGDPTCATTGLAPGSMCETTVNDAINASKQLMQEAAEAGVKETVYFFYPHISNPALNEVLDEAYPMARAACEDQQIMDCTFIDTREACGALPNPIGPDGIHPATNCSNAIADLMWEVMEENCANGVIDYP